MPPKAAPDGLRSQDSVGRHAPLLHPGPGRSYPARPVSPAGQEAGEMAGGSHVPTQNRGECQRQTGLLFNTSERASEPFLKVQCAQGVKGQPPPSPAPGVTDTAVRISCLPVRERGRNAVIFLRQTKAENCLPRVWDEALLHQVSKLDRTRGCFFPRPEGQGLRPGGSTGHVRDRGLFPGHPRLGLVLRLCPAAPPASQPRQAAPSGPTRPPHPRLE